MTSKGLPVFLGRWWSAVEEHNQWVVDGVQDCLRNLNSMPENSLDDFVKLSQVRAIAQKDEKAIQFLIEGEHKRFYLFLWRGELNFEAVNEDPICHCAEIKGYHDLALMTDNLKADGWLTRYHNSRFQLMDTISEEVTRRFYIERIERCRKDPTIVPPSLLEEVKHHVPWLLK